MKRLSAWVLMFCVLAGLAGCGRPDEAQEQDKLIGLLLGERYDELDKQLADAQEQYRTGKLPSNDWAGRFLALAALDARFDGLFNQWVEAGGTGFSRLARGMHLQHRAWVARGNKPAADTTDAEFAAMRELAAQARGDLLAAGKSLPNCALCTGELINNNRALDDHATDRKLLDTALSQDPKMWWPVLAYYQGIYPNWDSYEEIENFIAEMRRRLDDTALVDNMESRMYRDRARQVLQFAFVDSQDRAIALYEKGVNAHPSGRLLRELADIYIRNGKFVRAAELLEQDLAVNTPLRLDSMDKLIEAYLAFGQNGKADKLVSRRAEMKQRYPHLYLE